MPIKETEGRGWTQVVISLRDMRSAEEGLRNGKIEAYAVSNSPRSAKEEWRERQEFLLRVLPKWGIQPPEENRSLEGERPLVAHWIEGCLKYTCELPQNGWLTPTQVARFLAVYNDTDPKAERYRVYRLIKSGDLKVEKGGGVRNQEKKQGLRKISASSLRKYIRKKEQEKATRGSGNKNRAERG